MSKLFFSSTYQLKSEHKAFQVLTSWFIFHFMLIKMTELVFKGTF